MSEHIDEARPCNNKLAFSKGLLWNFRSEPVFLQHERRNTQSCFLS